MEEEMSKTKKPRLTVQGDDPTRFLSRLRSLLIEKKSEAIDKLYKTSSQGKKENHKDEKTHGRHRRSED